MFSLSLSTSGLAHRVSRLLPCLILLLPLSAWAQNGDKPIAFPHITVSGHGEVSVRPDKMEITLGVVTENKSSQTAARQNADASTKVQAAIRLAGVADKDIRTVNYSILPVYTDVPFGAVPLDAKGQPRKPELIGYRVYNQVRVILRDMSKMSNVVDAATTAGSNSVEGISLGVEDRRAAEDEALEKAVQDARRKAERMAKAANVSITGVYEISDQSGYNPGPMRYAAAPGGGASTPIASGDITLSASVNIIFSTGVQPPRGARLPNAKRVLRTAHAGKSTVVVRKAVTARQQAGF